MQENQATPHKRVLVTAGCTGLGLYFTRLLLRSGYTVHPTSRRPEGLESLKNDPEIKTFCNQARCVPMLLKYNEPFIEQFTDIMLDKGHCFYALVNNAVSHSKPPMLDDIRLKDFHQAFDTNVFLTAILTIKLTESGLIQTSGRIVNISSFYSRTIPDDRIYDKDMIPSGMIYSSSKACLNYISKYLAVNFASKNICVNSILPGGIEDSTCQTPFFQREYKKRVPMNKMALMENIGDALIFCLSENNTYFTGQELLIDGGWSLW